MGMLLAQELVVVRSEVDDGQPAPGRKGTGGLGDGRLRVGEVVQHLMQRHDVEPVRLDRQMVGVAVAHGNLSEPGGIELGAGEGQHLARGVHADGAPRQRRQDLQHPPGAGSHVEKRLDRCVAELRQKHRLDIGIGRMQRPQPVPSRGVGREIGGRVLGPLRAHGREPLRIAHQNGIRGREARLQRADDLLDRRVVRQAKIGPGPFLIALQHATFDQQAQMAGDAGLGLAEYGREIADGEFVIAQEQHDAQARRLTERLQTLHPFRQTHRVGHRPRLHI